MDVEQKCPHWHVREYLEAAKRARHCADSARNRQAEQILQEIDHLGLLSQAGEDVDFDDFDFAGDDIEPLPSCILPGPSWVGGNIVEQSAVVPRDLDVIATTGPPPFRPTPRASVGGSGPGIPRPTLPRMDVADIGDLGGEHQSARPVKSGK